MRPSLDLWDYRRRVADCYDSVRKTGPGIETWNRWRAHRDELFAAHPESPIDDLDTFDGLEYFPYDPEWRTVAKFAAGPGEEVVAQHRGGGATTFVNLGRLDFEVKGHLASLGLLWLDSYGGGVFLPFRDETNSTETYGGGRYLLDSTKGADLGHFGDEVVLDFNYAYNPSCVYSDRWSCPLAPAGNTLSFAVRAGERLPDAANT